MPANVYDQHRASFAQVSAYVIVRNGERFATIALKYPKDGAGRLLSYVHFLGEPMVRGFAGGYGYDKASASLANAARKLALPDGCYQDGTPYYTPAQAADFALFRDTLSRDDGKDWQARLRDAGFKVWLAV